MTSSARLIDCLISSTSGENVVFGIEHVRCGLGPVPGEVSVLKDYQTYHAFSCSSLRVPKVGSPQRLCTLAFLVLAEPMRHMMNHSAILSLLGAISPSGSRSHGEGPFS